MTNSACVKGAKPLQSRKARQIGTGKDHSTWLVNNMIMHGSPHRDATAPGPRIYRVKPSLFRPEKDIPTFKEEPKTENKKPKGIFGKLKSMFRRSPK